MNRRYTNQDVLDDDRLVVLAYRYLFEYTGTFHVVLDFKKLYDKGEALNATQIRTVLNCMLADARVQSMPEPEPRIFNAGRELARAVLGMPISHRRTERLRPSSIVLGTTWKKPFLVSVSPRACRIHGLDPVRSTLTHYPKAVPQKQYVVRIVPFCSSQLSMVNMRMLTFEQAEALVGTFNSYLDAFTYCKTCMGVSAERSKS